MYAIKLPSDQLAKFQLSMLLFCNAALKTCASDAKTLMDNIDRGAFSRDNVTPNGGIVPKKMNINWNYNFVLSTWSQIFRSMNRKSKIFSKVRIFPSVS